MIYKYTGDTITINAYNIYGRKLVNGRWWIENLPTPTGYTVKALVDDDDDNTSDDFTYFSQLAPSNRTDTAYTKTYANTFIASSQLFNTTYQRYPSYARAYICCQPLFDSNYDGRIIKELVQVNQASTSIEDIRFYGYLFGDPNSMVMIGDNIPLLNDDYTAPSEYSASTGYYGQIFAAQLSSVEYMGNLAKITYTILPQNTYNKTTTISKTSGALIVDGSYFIAGLYTGSSDIKIQSYDARSSNTARFTVAEYLQEYGWPTAVTYTTYKYTLTNNVPIGVVQNIDPCYYNTKSFIDETRYFLYTYNETNTTYCNVLESGHYKFAYRLIPKPGYCSPIEYTLSNNNFVSIYVNKVNQKPPEINTTNAIVTYPAKASLTVYNGGFESGYYGYYYGYYAGQIYWSDGVVGNTRTLSGANSTKTVRCYITGDNNFAASGWSNYVTMKVQSTTAATTTPPQLSKT